MCAPCERTNQKLLGPKHAARVNLSRNAFFSSRSERKHFLWRWYRRKKHKRKNRNMVYRALYSYRQVRVATLFPNIFFVSFLYVEYPARQRFLALFSRWETRGTSARNRTILWSRRRPRPGTNKLKKQLLTSLKRVLNLRMADVSQNAGWKHLLGLESARAALCK